MTSTSIELSRGTLIDLSRIHRIDTWASDEYPGDYGWTTYYVDHQPIPLFLTEDDYNKLKQALKERWVEGD